MKRARIAFFVAADAFYLLDANAFSPADSLSSPDSVDNSYLGLLCL